MRISEIIQRLEEIKLSHGDLPVAVFNEDDWQFFPVVAAVLERHDEESHVFGETEVLPIGRFVYLSEWTPDKDDSDVE